MKSRKFLAQFAADTNMHASPTGKRTDISPVHANVKGKVSSKELATKVLPLQQAKLQVLKEKLERERNPQLPALVTARLPSYHAKEEVSPKRNDPLVTPIKRFLERDAMFPAAPKPTLPPQLPPIPESTAESICEAQPNLVPALRERERDGNKRHEDDAEHPLSLQARPDKVVQKSPQTLRRSGRKSLRTEQNDSCGRPGHPPRTRTSGLVSYC